MKAPLTDSFVDSESVIDTYNADAYAGKHSFQPNNTKVQHTDRPPTFPKMNKNLISDGSQNQFGFSKYVDRLDEEDILKWSMALDFEEYSREWLTTATSLPSDIGGFASISSQIASTLGFRMNKGLSASESTNKKLPRITR